MNKLMNAALGFLARREYSQKELTERLSRQFPKDEVQQVIAECVQKRLLSDERFVESRIRHRIQQGYGPRWIEQDLRHHGIENDLIIAHLPDDENFWIEQAYRLIEKKNQKMDKDLQKLQRFLYQKGYSQRYISQALKMRDI
jgi:regulatory protein